MNEYSYAGMKSWLRYNVVSHNPDFVPLDFHLFVHWKMHFVKEFSDDKPVETAVQKWVYKADNLHHTGMTTALIKNGI